MTWSIVSLKALGDFVIACHARRRIPVAESSRVQIVAAAHLRPLASAIGVSDVVFIAGDGGNSVPAAFDARRRGAVAALASLIRLRVQLAALPTRDVYLFDRLGLRERLLVERHRRRPLLEADNIYLAYEKTLRAAGFHPTENASPGRSISRYAVIVPASRIADKTLPKNTLDALIAQLESAGFQAEILLLDGDDVQVPRAAAVRRVPRNFPALIERIRSADLVLSADSLAAHLCETYAVPCFVVSPVANEYWLPASCFRSRAWCTFDDMQPVADWLSSRES